MKKIFSTTIACVMTFLGFSCQDKPNFRSVSVDEFATVIADSDVVVLDVRTADEHQAGCIEGTTLHIDVLKSNFDSLAVASIKKGSTVALYCRSGNRSKRAASQLAEKGFKVIELATGYNSWIDAVQNTSEE